MKKSIAVILSLCFLSTNTLAAVRDEQSQELNNLIAQCEDGGFSVDYEKSAVAVFDLFASLEDEETNDDTISSEQKSYNKTSLTKIYNETKSKLTGYLDGSIKPLPQITPQPDSTRNINGNIFVNSAGDPLFSVGFGHFDEVFSDADTLKKIGSGNIQIETGPKFVSNETDVCMWKILKNNGCDGDVTLVESDGNTSLKVENRTGEANKYILLSQIVPVEPNKRYIYSLDAVSESSTAITVYIDGFETRDTINVGSQKKTYKSASVFKTGTDQSYITFMISVNNGAAVTFDNISVKAIPGNKNVLKNGDFEKKGNYYFHLDNLQPLIQEINAVHEKGFSVDFLLSPHYVPDFMMNKYPDLKNNSRYGYSFNTSQTEYRQLISDYIEFVLSLVKNIDSVCISNEPNFCSSGAYDYFNPLFREWMRKKYSDDISNLNAAHGNSYSAFDDVNIPSYLKNTSGYPKADPLFYDYMLFNEEVFADWHKMMTDCVKNIRPDLPVHAKMQDYLFLYDGAAVAKMLFGTDAELFAEFCDIAGNDATTYVSQPRSRLGTMMWYDFLSSVTDKPVYNSEDHVITDYNSTFSDETAQNVRYELLNGAVHGLCGSSLWTWHRNLSGINTLFKNFPYATYMVGKTMLDLKRLNNELAAFIKADKDIALFYSKASRVMDTKVYEAALENDYAALNSLGHKIGFVTERHPEKLSKYKTLVLTNVKYIPESSVSEIASFIKNGGHVIIDGSDALSYTEYGLSAQSEDRTYIRNNSYYMNSCTAADFNNALASIGESTSIVYEGNKTADGIDFKKVNYDGDNIIALTNVTDTEKTVSMAGKYINLFDLSEYDGSITLKPYEPMLLAEKTDIPKVNSTIDITEEYVKFDIGYSVSYAKDVTVSAAARDKNGKLAAMAYCQRFAEAEKDYRFSGTLEAKDSDSVEITIYDAANVILYHEVKYK